jgi:hypothetical protein
VAKLGSVNATEPPDHSEVPAVLVQTAQIDRPARLIATPTELVLILQAGLLITPEVVEYLGALLERV